MKIQHNLSAANAGRQLGVTSSRLKKSTEKLSSGYRINRAADDAAGLSISEKLRSQIRGLNQATNNAHDGISLLQTAEGGLNEQHSIIQRVRELVIQAANDTNTTEDRRAVASEVKSLVDELENISANTRFNTHRLLKQGSMYGTGSFELQVGAQSKQSIKINIPCVDAICLHMTPDDMLVNDDTFATSSHTTIAGLLENVDYALNKVSDARTSVGTLQNRLEHTISNLENTSENTQAGESRIRDLDMADEMVKYSKESILQQAAQAMLAQANQANQGILALLG